MSRGAAFDFLCDCLAARTREAWPSSQVSFDWTTFITIAHEFRVASAVVPRRGHEILSETMPNGALTFFEGCVAQRRQVSEGIRNQAIEIAHILNRVDVAPIVMKGGAHLLSDLYPDIGMRQMDDLDMLVPADRIGACVAALEAAGFAPSTDYEHPRAHHVPPLQRQDLPVPLELHHHVLAHPAGDFLPAAEMIAACRELPGLGAHIRVPSPDFAVMHNIAHAQLNDHGYIYGFLDLRALLDLVLLTQTHGDQIDWERIDERFEQGGRGLALRYHLLCAANLLGLQRPGLPRRGAAYLLYRRALVQAANPRAMSLNFRLLRPVMLLRRELSEKDLRRRLGRNLTDGAWWRRHLDAVRGR